MAARRRTMVVAALALAALGPGLGAWSRLSYHEAIVGQGAREMLATGDWLVPTLGGRPWLEKPPLAHWLVAAVGVVFGGVDATVARVPSALAAGVLAIVVAGWAARRFGAPVGLLAGAVQATSAWWVTRGRLAEADILLAALVTASMVAFDRLRQGALHRGRDARLFFVLVGATALAKGIGFGAVLVGVAAGVTLLWDRDAGTARRLFDPVGLGLGAVVALAWPLAVLARYPEAGGLWWGHLGGRLGMAGEAPRFAAEGWAEYLATPFVALLPWTPLVVVGALGSWGRARGERHGADRLLWCWAVAPAVVVTLSPARNGHYLLPMLPPLAVWGSLGLMRGAAMLAARGGREMDWRRPLGLTAGVALAWGLGFAFAGPRLDARGKGAEWRWYEQVSEQLGPREPVVLLHDAPDRSDRWDRAPYPTPFGAVPPDLAARLFHLGPGRRVAWCAGPAELEDALHQLGARYVIARERDVPKETIVARSPGYRADRIFCVAAVAIDDEVANLRGRPR